ncbi:MAG TPA: ATP-binding protein [Candidatus Acidoferrales bacterium]|nr:ATP-binding protein [Candidatus Acidoferrales bacterium]
MAEGAAAFIVKQGAADCLRQDRVDRLGEVVHRALERKRIGAPLRKSEERYRALFDGIPVGLYRSTVGGEILDANPALLKMLACPNLETLRTVKAGDLYVDPEVREQWIAALEKNGVVSDFEERVRKFDGSVIWVTASARIVRDPSGGPSYLEGAAEDITERKLVQEANIKAREADRANRAKSEFLSRMSHVLRTPLNAMLGFAQMLEMGPLSPDQRKSIDQILKSGRHLVELITEALEISRIEAGQLAISLEPVPLTDAVQETLSLVAPLAAKANIRLRIEAAGGPQRYVVADRQRVKQVLLNLLSNAVKYNRPGGSVTLSSEDAPQGRLRIKVSDTGPGISQEKMNRLFAPFDRLGAEQTEIEGTGLGLLLCKRLVEAMGGTLGVESTEGKGSTFWVEFARGEGAPAHG